MLTSLFVYMDMPLYVLVTAPRLEAKTSFLFVVIDAKVAGQGESGPFMTKV